MADVLLIDHDPTTAKVIEKTLQAVGHVVWTTSSGAEGLEFLADHHADAIIVTLPLHDKSASDPRRPRRRRAKPPVAMVVTASAKVTEVLSAIQQGTTDGLARPVSEERLRHIVECALSGMHGDAPADPENEAGAPQPHAAARWANAVIPIIDCPKDPRTMTGWSRWIAASPGAIRNWCFTAGIGPRRSLVFGRLLRAVILSEGGRHRPENLLDVVDRRTLFGLLRLGGFDETRLFPIEPQEFLRRQILVRDVEALLQIERALNERHQPFKPLSCPA